MSRPKIKTYKIGDVYRYAHLKRDGMWIELSIEDDGNMSIMTRHPTQLAHLLAMHRTCQEFEGCVQLYSGSATLYCELFAPGHPQSAVKHFIAEGDLEALRIECFATPDLPTDVELQAVENYSTRLGVPFVTWENVDERFTCEDVIEHYLAAPDSEGVVFKNGNLLDWARHKATLTTDLVITGFTEGKGKYTGLVGALELSLYVPGEDGMPGSYEYVTKVSGMDDATRRAISDDEDQYHGRVVEVAYQYVGAGGGLRHPRFVRFRDDKQPEECTEL